MIDNKSDTFDNCSQAFLVWLGYSLKCIHFNMFKISTSNAMCRMNKATKESRDDVKKSSGWHKSRWESSEWTIWPNWSNQKLLFRNLVFRFVQPIGYFLPCFQRSLLLSGVRQNI